jgi:hypothetical protein
MWLVWQITGVSAGNGKKWPKDHLLAVDWDG